MVLLVEGMLVRNIAKQQPFIGASKLADTIAFLNAASSQYVFTAYNEAKQWIQNYPLVDKENVSVFHHGVDTELFTPVGKSKARDRLSITVANGEIVIGFVGSFKPYHCLEDLIHATKEFRDQGNSVKLLLVGDGPEKPWIEALVEENGLEEETMFTGYVDQEMVPLYIGASDIMYGVIDPDHWGYPMKIQEYLSSGRPVIAHNDDELKFIKERGLGFLVEEVSPMKIAEMLNVYHSMADLTQTEMEMRARKYILNNQTWEDYADSIIDQLQLDIS